MKNHTKLVHTVVLGAENTNETAKKGKEVQKTAIDAVDYLVQTENAGVSYHRRSLSLPDIFTSSLKFYSLPSLYELFADSTTLPSK